MEHLCMCVCGGLSPPAVGSWNAGCPCGNRELPRGFPKVLPGNSASSPKATGSLRQGSLSRWAAHLRPPKTGFCPLPLGRSEPTVTEGRFGEWPGVGFHPPRPPGTCFKKNKACGSELCKCALEAENKVSWGDGASLPPAPAFPGSLAPALSFPTISGEEKNNQNHQKDIKNPPLQGVYSYQWNRLRKR